MRTPQLYVVLQEPTARNRSVYVVYVFHCLAVSKADALGQFSRAIATDDKTYKKPTAQVVASGSLIRV